MARLPEIQDRGVTLQQPRSSVSAAEIADPYQQLSNILGDAADIVHAKAKDDAQTVGENAVYRDSDGRLQVTSKSNWSDLGRAYNNAAHQAYAARLAGDIRTNGVALGNAAAGDVNKFASSWKSFSDTTLSSVPKNVRGPVRTMLEQEGARLQLGVSEQKRQRDIRTFEGDIKSEISLLDDEMSALARDGGTSTDDYRQKQAQLKSLYGTLATNPDFTVGEKEADIALRRMESRHMAEAMVGSVQRTLKRDGVVAAQKEAERILTDDSLALTPAERRQYSGLATEEIKSVQAQAKADLKPVQAQAKSFTENLKQGLGIDNPDIDTTATQLARGGDVTGAMDLIAARSRARFLKSFNAAPNGDQTAALEGSMAKANRSAPSRARPISVAPQLSGRIKQAVDHYVSAGLSPIMAAGIVGNLVRESNLNTGALNPGDGADGSDSFGAGQWNGARKRALVAFAKDRGTSPDDFNTQLDFVLHELQTTEGAAFQRLKSARTVQDATAAMAGYERPRGWSPENPQGADGWSVRLSMAQKAAELAGVDASALGTTGAGIDVDPEVVKAMREEVTADAKSLWTDMQDGMKKGYSPSPDELNLFSRQLALIDDQDFHSQVSQFFESDAAANAIAALPPDQIDTFISNLKADAADGASIAQQNIIAAVQDAQAARVKALADDPLGYAVEHQISKPLPVLDLEGDPAAIGAAFAARQNAADVLKARGDVGDVSALRPQEQADLARFMSSATPAEQMNVLGAMSQNLDHDTFAATLTKIAGKSGLAPVAAAGALSSVNPAAAEGILRGTALLKENPNLAPKQTDDNRATIDELLPTTAFAPSLEGSRQSLLEAARARYADLSHQAGDTSGELSEDRMTQALSEVTGGLVDMGGYETIAPRYGMSQDDFDGMIAGLTNDSFSFASWADGGRVTASDVRNNARLRAVGDGQYVVELGPESAPSYLMQRLPQRPGQTENPIWQQAQDQYPILRDLGISFVRTRGDTSGNMLESWPKGETGTAEYPRPKSLPLDKFGVQVFSEKTRPIDVLGDVVSHQLVKTDPKIKGYYDQFVSSLTPDQKARLHEQYKYAQKNEGEKRPFDQWADMAGIPAYFRGYAFDQWPKERAGQLYTPKQISMFDDMMGYLTSKSSDSGPVHGGGVGGVFVLDLRGK